LVPTATVGTSQIIRTICAETSVTNYELTFVIQDDSVDRGPKLLSIKNYAIEIMA